ncbi:MAG TPA: hypothetical protein VNH83_12645 [Bryobacteraceae bacterium]|nr:hypothetical protein [Bryobacteraceae bacterium]
MKRSIYVVIVALAACGSPTRPVPVPTPPPSVLVDIATLLFSTPCRDIGRTTVCDDIAPDGKITRITYTKGNHLGLGGEEIQTHSIYQIDTKRNCIAVVQEETRIHSDLSLQALQTYLVGPSDLGHSGWVVYPADVGASPCWISALRVTAPLTLRTGGEYSYVWARFDANGNPNSQSRGRFSDSTVLNIGSTETTLTERYQDISLDPDAPVYCGVGTYGPSGMISIRQDLGACK